VPISGKLKTLKAKQVLRQGGLLGHQTSTLAGIAASANSTKGIQKVQAFKQRQGPFLLLADSIPTALKQAIYIPVALRKLAKKSWPGAVTLVFPARQHLHEACYLKRNIAVRVDGDAETRRLAQICGGLLLSSSLNRKGGPVQKPDYKLKFRWQRHLSTVIKGGKQSHNQASQIFKVSGNSVARLR
jgi:L-threonylcarbamoyladenylate synthase